MPFCNRHFATLRPNQPRQKNMPKNNKNIPVNSMDDNMGQGISIDRISIKKADFTTAGQYAEAKQSHRDEGHTFHFVEKGTVLIEIDFQQHRITAPSVVYMHPNQVHCIVDFKDITVCSLAIKNENIRPEYLVYLETIAPANPLLLTKTTHSTIPDIFSLCLFFTKQKNNKLYYPLLRDSCNTLIAFLTSQFLNQSGPSPHLSRFETVTRSFKKILEKSYVTMKRPGGYARQLNISTHYLNECIRHTTGYSPSQLIRDRIILEAKRLLRHSGKSVKEIAFDLGYTDYPYFTRMFANSTGLTAGAFRSKNHV